MRCPYHLNNVKNLKNTHGRVSLLVKLQAKNYFNSQNAENTNRDYFSFSRMEGRYIGSKWQTVYVFSKFNVSFMKEEWKRYIFCNTLNY